MSYFWKLGHELLQALMHWIRVRGAVVQPRRVVTRE
jgi:hypothetical protein